MLQQQKTAPPAGLLFLMELFWLVVFVELPSHPQRSLIRCLASTLSWSKNRPSGHVVSFSFWHVCLFIGSVFLVFGNTAFQNVAFSSLPDLRESLSVIPPSFTSFQIRPPLLSHPPWWFSSPLPRLARCSDASAACTPLLLQRWRLRVPKLEIAGGKLMWRQRWQRRRWEEFIPGIWSLNWHLELFFSIVGSKCFTSVWNRGLFYRLTQESRWKYGVDLSTNPSSWWGYKLWAPAVKRACTSCSMFAVLRPPPLHCWYRCTVAWWIIERTQWSRERPV